MSAQTDASTPLHLLKPDYAVPYGIPKPDEVKAVLDRVFAYLDGVTPIGFINEKTGDAVTDASKIDADTIIRRGDFRIVSYEWGVTYAGMLLASGCDGRSAIPRLCRKTARLYRGFRSLVHAVNDALL